MPVTLLGIRHHGPGSSRHVQEYLNQHRPDLILVEGPSEAEALLPFLKSPELKPPVAVLAYQTDLTSNSVFYPFAVFSPEWAAMQYASKNEVPLHFFDLPLTHSLGIAADKLKKAQEAQAAAEAQAEAGADTASADAASADTASAPDAPAETAEASQPDSEQADSEQADSDSAQIPLFADTDETFGLDPFDYLAKIEGMPDGEAWWEAHIEQRLDSENVFEAVQEVITELREALPDHTSDRDRLREAWMRKQLRAAEKEYENIVVVCGAWHVPALAKRPPVKEDNALLKGLPKAKVEVTWIPWTYSRLSVQSGYGAGIYSPGWYHHIYHNRKDDGALWLTMAAKVLRKEGKDISVAHVMETLRLAQTLAALRCLPHPSLSEFNEAITTVMGFGDSIILEMVKKELIVSDRMGKVPKDVPKVPLLADIEKLQKTNRVPFKNEEVTQKLDLRKPLDLSRSIFFSRLRLLEITWAQLVGGSRTNTFTESWRLQYSPKHILQIIDKAIYGTTLEEAVIGFVQTNLAQTDSIAELSELLDKAIPCDLPKLVDALTQRIDALSASTSDMLELFAAIPNLTKIIRYGSVRKFDTAPIERMVRTIMARILAGAVLICINIDDDAAHTIEGRISEVNYALISLNDQDYLDMWVSLMETIHQTANVHPLLSGTALRVLREQGKLERTELERSVSYYTSLAFEPSKMALWLEGFLKDSELLLVHDNSLWMLVNNFLDKLDDEVFIEILPILRRTFANFDVTARVKLGRKAKDYYEKGVTLDAGGQSVGTGAGTSATQAADGQVAEQPVSEHSQQVVSLVSMLFGMPAPKT